jgi:protocatechuate 3,4-dioxygenase alpha subunit
MSDDDLVSTPSQTVGPFFDFGLVTTFHRRPGSPPIEGQIRLTVRVFDGDGVPLDDAVVEFWQRGDQPAAGAGTTSTALTSECGRAATGADGSCELLVSRPRSAAGDVPAPAAHVNLCLLARGLLRQVYTRVYFAGDPALASDPVLALVPADRQATLLAQPDPKEAGRWSFEIHLQGPQETVFFDR